MNLRRVEDAVATEALAKKDTDSLRIVALECLPENDPRAKMSSIRGTGSTERFILRGHSFLESRGVQA